MYLGFGRAEQEHGEERDDAIDQKDQILRVDAGGADRGVGDDRDATEEPERAHGDRALLPHALEVLRVPLLEAQLVDHHQVHKLVRVCAEQGMQSQ
eukprot:scaffold39753_cov65-Phaeocystis_antarctica.AAC.7